jgi:hypothetical protein
VLVTGFNQKLGISNEWFAMGDTLALTVLGQVSCFLKYGYVKYFMEVSYCSCYNAALIAVPFTARVFL